MPSGLRKMLLPKNIKNKVLLIVILLNLSEVKAQHFIIKVYQNNDLVDISKPIELKYAENQLVFKIVQPHKSSTDLIYKLSGLSDRIDTCTNCRTIIFANLYGGEYNFWVKNLKNNQETNLNFKIEAQFWQKSTFYLSVLFYAVVVIGVIIYFFFSYRLRQQLRTQHIRDNIARDLHDDMGSYLGSISILSQNVEKLTQKDPEKARASLQKIGETARQVMDTMDDIVWSINPMHDSMEQIMNRMKDFGNEIFFSQEVEMEFLASESIKKINISLEKRRDFFLVFKEALTNIQKYAQASKVSVQLLSNGNHITMLIKDNGCGFDIDNLPKTRTMGGNGLKNMQSRAEKLGGKLQIESKVNIGTSIKLEFEQ